MGVETSPSVDIGLRGEEALMHISNCLGEVISKGTLAKFLEHSHFMAPSLFLDLRVLDHHATNSDGRSRPSLSLALPQLAVYRGPFFLR